MSYVENCQIYWDRQDPANEGWWCRYYVNGTEHGFELDGPEELSEALNLCHYAADVLEDFNDTTITVYFGEQPCLRWCGPRDWTWL